MKGNRLWLLATVAAIALIVVVGWLLGINPRFAEAVTAASDRATVEALNAAQAAEIAALREQRENLADIEDELLELRQSIPATADTDSFIESLTAAAGAAGVELSRVSFATPGPWGASGTAPGAPSPDSQPGMDSPPIPTAPEGVLTLSVGIELTGDPVAVTAVLRHLQSEPRLFLVTDFLYDRADEGKGSITGFLFIIRDPASAQPVEGESLPAEPVPAATSTP